MIYKNVASQKLAVYAYTASTGAAKTGDAANITCYESINWGAADQLDDTNPTELDSTNMPGWYVFDLTQAETNGEVLVFAPKSATSGVVLEQVQVFTLDATISSRASQSSVDDVPTVAELHARTLPSADYFDPATDTVANVTTVGSVTGAVGSVTGAVGSVTAGVTVTTNNDKTGYALTAAYDAAKTAAQAGDAMTLTAAYDAAKTAAQAGDAMTLTAAYDAAKTAAQAGDAMTLTAAYDAAKTAAAPGAQMDLVNAPNATAIAAFQAGLALAATALSNATWTDGRAALLDYLDAAITSRLATAGYTAPDNASITAIKAKTDNLPADPADDSDIDAQLAAIAAYIDTEVAAILAAVDTEIAAIKAKTDSLTFTTAGKVDARVDNVAGTAVAGPNDLKADVSALATSAEIAALNDLSAADVADAVWNETLADHLNAGSTGEGLNAAGSAGDPWSTALPGAYGAGSAGYIVGNRLDATVSSRSTLTEAQANAQAFAALVDYDAPTKAELDTAQAAVQSDVAALNNVSAGEVADAVWDELLAGHAGAGTAGAALSAATAPTAGDVADAVWDEVLADHLGAGSTGAGLNAAGSAGDPWATALPGDYGAGSAGNILGNRLDAAVSSRAPANEYDAVLDAAISSRLAGASYTAPDNAGITTLLDRLTAARASYLDKLNVSGALAHSDAADSYKADVSSLATQAAIDALVLLIGAIKAQTDLLPASPAATGDEMALTEEARAAVEATLAAAHGAGSWEGGGGGGVTFPAGAIEYTYTVTNSVTGLPIEGVEVWFSTDVEGANIVWAGVTDAFGVARDVLEAKPWLDAGTYYVWRQKTNYAFTNPAVEIVS